jgi:Tol biopolymer transport system component
MLALVVRVLGTMAVVAILGCGQPRSGAAPQAAEQASFEEAERGLSPATDRIAYVNPGGELFIVNPDGSDPVQLTGAERAGQPSVGLLAQVLAPNEVHAWPTWAPDGSKIAVSRVVVGENTAEVSVLSIDVNSAQTTTVFRNESPSLVADGAPHYLYWSPDSRSLAFLVGGQSGLMLYVWDEASGNADPVATGAPLYFHWNGSGESLALHVGPEVEVVSLVQGETRRAVTDNSVGGRVAAFSPDGTHLAYVVNSGNEGQLMMAPADMPDEGRALMDVSDLTAFLWSPDGSEIAVAQRGGTGSSLFDTLVVVPAGGGEARVLTEEQLIAFFWAPTGDRIAWVAVDSARREWSGWWPPQPAESRGGCSGSARLARPSRCLAISTSTLTLILLGRRTGRRWW